MSDAAIPQPAWDVPEGPQSDFQWERYLRDLLKTSQKGLLFFDAFKMSQTSQNISKKMSIPWRTWDVSKISLTSICDFYTAKLVSCDFRKVIAISDKLEVVSLETLKKWNVFWEQFIDISHACHEYLWADICVRVLESQRSSKPNSRSIIYYF